MPDEARPLNRRVEELLWATQHIAQLQQGTILLPFPLILLVYTIWVQTHGVSLGQLWLLPAGVILGFAGAIAINRRYTRQYGYVTQPQPQLEQSPVLSILNPTPLPKPLHSTAHRTTNLVFLCMYLGILPLVHLREEPLLYMSFCCWLLLLPRCFLRTPRISILQVRRALSIGALLLVVGMTAAGLIAVRFRPCAIFSKWPFMYVLCGCYFVLAAYDHWLLTHLLRGGHSGHPFLEANDE